MLTRLADLAGRRARLVILAAVLFTALSVVLGASRLGGLSSDGFDDPAAEAVRAQDRVVAATGADPGETIIALVRPGAPVASPAGRDALARAERTLGGVPGVAAVVAPRGDGSPQVARDGRSAYLVAALRADADAAEVVAGAREAFAGDGTVTLGGAVVADEEIGEIIGQDILRAELIAFPILFLVSLFVFRGLVASLLPVMVGMVTVLGGFLGLALANEVTTISVYATNLVIGLGLGLAIDYALLVVSRYREEIARRVAAAMAGLMIFPQDFLFSMGLGGILAAAVAATASLTLLPAVLALLGARVNSGAPARWKRRTAEADRPVTSGGWYRLSRYVMRRPGRIAAVAAGVMVLLALPAAGISFTAIDAGVLPSSSSARQVSDALETGFRQDRSDPVTLAVRAPDTPAARAALGAYAARVGAVPGVAAVTTPEPLGSGTWRIDAYLADRPLSAAAEDAVDAVRAIPAPYDTLVGGTTAGLADQKASLAAHLPWAAAAIALATMVILFLLTGSVVLPVMAIVMNLLTLGATLGILALAFQEGWLEGLLGFDSIGGVSTTQPILIAALAFGLSTDYAVFLLSRIKEARDSGLDDREAVAVGLERTGRIVTAAAVLFCIAMGAFATSQIVIIKELGVGTVVAVLLDATIVRALLVPSLMAMLGRWSWWAPRPLVRLHAWIGLAEASGQPAPAR
ncbi:MAG: MMPL family transporter [Thermoleophilia bacterium]|nr:MMPL family transporter [Thermoleophilia bacterium]